MSKFRNRRNSVCLLMSLSVFIAVILIACAKTGPEQATGPVASHAPPPSPAPVVTTEPRPMDIDADGISNEAHMDTDNDGISRYTGKKKKQGAEVKPPPATWKRATAGANTARLMIGDREELQILGTQINVRVDGFRARVLMDIFFYNDRNRRFEGTFKLRLPNGASPYFLAFGESVYRNDGEIPDVPFTDRETGEKNGWTPDRIMKDRAAQWFAPKEARMVTKEKAAVAYWETVHRRRVDPALMEWSGAGIFSARIFPVQPRKLHQIVIGYDVDLLRVGSDLAYTLDLPENSTNTMVDIRVKEMPDLHTEMAPAAEFEKQGGYRRYHYEIPLERSLTLKLRNVRPLMMVGGKSDAPPCFAARFKPELPESPVKGSPDAVFLVDVSMSSNPERFNIWLSLMQAILENNQNSLKRFAVLFFNVESFWWKPEFTRNSQENRKALAAFAQTLALEGATDLEAALSEAAHPSWNEALKPESGWDFFLLSDGSPTWGAREMYGLSKAMDSGNSGALFAYQTGLPGTDTRMLSHLARSSGGAVFSVVGEAEIIKASTAHRSRPWKLAGIEVAGGKDLLLAGRPASLFPGQTLLLTGKGIPEKNAAALLTVRRGDVEKQIRVPFSGRVESSLVPRIYGQTAVDHLEEFKEITRPESEVYARHFRVTGQTCSLLMLESEADYRRFNIIPEDDAFVVKSTQVSRIVEKIIGKASDRLTDSRSVFMDELEKMKEMPGMQFRISPALRIALNMMPDTSFDVKRTRLKCVERRRDRIPGLVREQLNAGRPEYDVFMVESARRLKNFGPHDALKALSSLMEHQPGDTVLSLDTGYSAMSLGLGGHAYHLFHRTAQMRPNEAPIYLSLARCLDDSGMTDLALAYYEVVLSGQWDGRFRELNKIAGIDYLRFLRRIQTGKLKTSVPDFVEARLDKMEGKYGKEPADMVITMMWNTDMTDVDLHVIEPNREKCYYGNRETSNGGSMTADVTRGFGPEMYRIKNAPAGKYRIRVNYFAKDQNRMSTRTRVFVTVYKNWCRPDEQRITKVVTLALNQKNHHITDVFIDD